MVYIESQFIGNERECERAIVFSSNLLISFITFNAADLAPEYGSPCVVWLYLSAYKTSKVISLLRTFNPYTIFSV